MGASSASFLAGISAANCAVIAHDHVAGVGDEPISAQGKSHLSKIAFHFLLAPLLTMMSMRSCDSLNMIS